ncbi:MAG: TolC family protein, partial [Desulfovibrio sp.]|nr:TolC family protein [Desulfovibrio sp.]
TMSSSVGNLFSGPAGAWSYGVSASVPIFDFGRNWYNLKDAEAQKERAIAVYRSTVQSAFKDIRQALTSQREADHIVKSIKNQVDSLRRAVDIAQLQYDNGYTDYLTVLDAERELFTAELSYASALQTRLNAVVSVCQALGGGWSERGEQPSFPIIDTKKLIETETSQKVSK